MHFFVLYLIRLSIRPGNTQGPLWDFCAPISIIVELWDWYQLFLTPQKIVVLQYTTIIEIGMQRAQRSLFAQPTEHHDS